MSRRSKERRLRNMGVGSATIEPQVSDATLQALALKQFRQVLKHGGNNGFIRVNTRDISNASDEDVGDSGATQ